MSQRTLILDSLALLHFVNEGPTAAAFSEQQSRSLQIHVDDERPFEVCQHTLFELASWSRQGTLSGGQTGMKLAFPFADWLSVAVAGPLVRVLDFGELAARICAEVPVLESFNIGQQLLLCSAYAEKARLITFDPILLDVAHEIEEVTSLSGKTWSLKIWT